MGKVQKEVFHEVRWEHHLLASANGLESLEHKAQGEFIQEARNHVAAEGYFILKKKGPTVKVGSGGFSELFQYCKRHDRQFHDKFEKRLAEALGMSLREVRNELTLIRVLRHINTRIPVDVLKSLLDFNKNFKAPPLYALIKQPVLVIFARAPSLSNIFKPKEFAELMLTFSEKLTIREALNGRAVGSSLNALINPEERMRLGFISQDPYDREDVKKLVEHVLQRKLTFQFVSACLSRKLLMKPDRYAELYGLVTLSPLACWRARLRGETPLTLGAAAELLHAHANVRDIKLAVEHLRHFDLDESIALAKRRVDPGFALRFHKTYGFSADDLASLHDRLELGETFLSRLSERKWLPGEKHFEFFSTMRQHHRLEFSEIQSIIAEIGSPSILRAEAYMSSLAAAAAPSQTEPAAPPREKVKTRGIARPEVQPSYGVDDGRISNPATQLVVPDRIVPSELPLLRFNEWKSVLSRLGYVQINEGTGSAHKTFKSTNGFGAVTLREAGGEPVGRPSIAGQFNSAGITKDALINALASSKPSRRWVRNNRDRFSKPGGSVLAAH